MALTPTDLKILKLARTNGNIFTKAYFAGFEFQPWQLYLHHCRQANPTIIGGVGSGKAQPLWSSILTPTGWTTMGEVRIGDRVIAADGQPALVIGVYPQGRRPIYRVTLSDGTQVDADADHIWVTRKDATRRWRTKTTLELCKGRHYLPIVDPIEFDVQPLPLHPYVLGALLGDGCFLDDGHGRAGCRFSSVDPEIVEQVRTCLPDGVRLRKEKGDNCDYHLSKTRGKTNPVLDALRELQLSGVKSTGKFIPECYKYAPLFVRIQLLQGLFDTDGCPGDLAGLEFVTTSFQLALDVQEIVYSLGGRCSIRTKETRYIYNGETKDGALAYRCYISLPPSIEPFSLSRKVKKRVRKTKYAYTARRVVSVEYIGEYEAQCIAVDHPQHLYVTDGYVLTHNTVGTGVSAATWCAMISDFHFMDVAPTSWQASLMFDAILRFAEAGTFKDKFVSRVVRKPYPMIEFYNMSTMRFMTAQDDITRIRGWEGDWMAGDEFGFVNTIERTVGIMRTRLRGKSVYGRPRLGRLSLTTTATDNPELWDRFDRMWDDPEEYVSFTVQTKDNPHLTERDIQLMQEDIPEEIRAVEMDGVRPMGRGRFFPLHVIKACEDASLNDLVHRQTTEEDPDPGFVYEETPRLGLIKYQTPAIPYHDYLIVGDPGTGNPPKRNAGAIGVFDITGFPDDFESKAQLVAFSWVYGNGRYDAFVEQYKSWWEYYHCDMQAALEATGPQKSFGEYAFTMGLSGQRMLVEEMDLSGNKKNEALQACMQLFNRGLWHLPFIRGMRTQLTGYDLPDTKLSQDIVSMLMTGAAWLRKWRIWGHDSVDMSRSPDDDEDDGWGEYPGTSSPRAAVRSAPLRGRPGR
jgi:hypothetical protein